MHATETVEDSGKLENWRKTDLFAQCSCHLAQFDGAVDVPAYLVQRQQTGLGGGAGAQHLQHYSHLKTSRHILWSAAIETRSPRHAHNDRY